ncbi:MAG: Protein GrpE [Candidatus Amesbacteria bacterium GW2011_GWB1_47_26]|uniref:Protein GrpE n=1 Tax=Candidatus Amesbacteria bacterium GW2011_GWC2_45_19 TaxID=1618366 RepID=A0A0G1M4F9_9BACT|nr:MAG: Protein GrpE [Candidatus Amesbacteria bacterium GW2011_GWC2_45_19]KKU38774.1 MAG: Protein GrpE [Candidatus Amesbacteria bacterium GW2011_GWA1_46_35]KKU69276.1 MAG: Protein GrpE [Microgenomates group bacterium GW2011_GWC1_47_20]KKU75092.1 MAG: Protein GrpE [Candidatus Amesbacteria bacterium GW2011_GWB1_47_26]KKU80389.1 MAG: Protein GrpE [Candidatus Amesbacteria bacterium GW2011_GWA2_47_70]
MKTKKSPNITPHPPLTASDASPRLDLRGGGPQAEGDTVKTLTENWKRALADYHNLVKRVDADKKDFVTYATANIMAKLLPTLDVLELAAIHSQDQGVQMAVKQFRDVLTAEGLQEISPKIGDSYNHEIHECLETLPGEPDNTIAEIVTKGYKINNYVIRPAKIKAYVKDNRN